MMAPAQGCVVQQLQLGRAVNSQQDLDPLSRELLILLAAHLDEGEYVWRQHVPIAVRHGRWKLRSILLPKAVLRQRRSILNKAACSAIAPRLSGAGQVIRSPSEAQPGATSTEEHASELQSLMRIS